MEPSHPGQTIKDCLTSSGLTVTEAAMRLGVSRKALSFLLNGKASVSMMMAFRLSKMFHTTMESWLIQQMQYDLWHFRNRDTSSVG